jgi:hypothetical protein
VSATAVNFDARQGCVFDMLFDELARVDDANRGNAGQVSAVTS